MSALNHAYRSLYTKLPKPSAILVSAPQIPIRHPPLAKPKTAEQIAQEAASRSIAKAFITVAFSHAHKEKKAKKTGWSISTISRSDTEKKETATTSPTPTPSTFSLLTSWIPSNPFATEPRLDTKTAEKLSALSTSFEKLKTENSTMLEELQKLKLQKVHAKMDHLTFKRALWCLQDGLEEVDERIEKMEEREERKW